MARTLAEFGVRVENITKPPAMRRVVMAGGLAGKQAALDAAAKDLGGDRAMSGMRRRVALSAGFDDTGSTAVRINFRPGGLWRLATDGRRSSGAIYPRRRGGKRAVLTPAGPRARSSYGPSGGQGTYHDAVREARVKVPKAAARQFSREVAAV